MSEEREREREMERDGETSAESRNGRKKVRRISSAKGGAEPGEREKDEVERKVGERKGQRIEEV